MISCSKPYPNNLLATITKINWLRRRGGGGALGTVMIGLHWISSGQLRSGSGQSQLSSGQCQVKLRSAEVCSGCAAAGAAAARWRRGSGGALGTVMIGLHGISSGQLRSSSGQSQLSSGQCQVKLRSAEVCSDCAAPGAAVARRRRRTWHCNDWITLDQLRSAQIKLRSISTQLRLMSGQAQVS